MRRRYDQAGGVVNASPPATFTPPGTAPGEAAAVPIAAGVSWCRLPLPFALSHINVWAIADGDGWAIVDTGARSAQAEACWEELLSGPFAGGITRVLVTHLHPDHVGMAGWLARRHHCALWMTQAEYLTCRLSQARGGPSREAVAFYHSAGWDGASLARSLDGGGLALMYELPDSYRRLRDRDQLVIGRQRWTVIVGSGHSPEHACLYCPELKLFISGDQVLPTISSNVSVNPDQPEADPLDDWLTSIGRIRRAVPSDVLVLPAHGEPFFGLHERLDALERGVREALARLRRALIEPGRVVDVFPALFKRPIRTEDQLLLKLATGEALSHLNHLVLRAQVIRVFDGAGVAWYQAAASPHDDVADTC